MRGLQWEGGEKHRSELLSGSLPWATHIHMDIYTGWERSIQPHMAMCLPKAIQTQHKSKASEQARINILL